VASRLAAHSAAAKFMRLILMFNETIPDGYGTVKQVVKTNKYEKFSHFEFLAIVAAKDVPPLS
jgi:hypothetical protein